MSCETLSDKLTGYLDGELDQRGVGEVETHLRQCVPCATRLERERRLRSAVQAQVKPLRAPDGLRARVRGALRAEVRAEVKERPRRSAWIPAWAATAAALVLGLAGGWQLTTWRVSRSEPDLATEIVASHVRSLQSDHLTDIGSSEHHTVKPWFAGKLDFSPPVPDFTIEGFPLIGGRLDYLGERQVAALVYGRRQHVINLFVWPSRDANALPAAASRRGYDVMHGAAGGMTYWAISDLNETELSQFAQLVAANLGAGATRP
ncbi:MAG TPA: zf-HC2 domain-containing protein [Gemmatimonadales bacterium]|nr:zf-HC2 domain-containing protein [Gemmatimonadales bacterium]